MCKNYSTADAETLRYYQQNATPAVARYEAAASPVASLFPLSLPPGSRVLDIGSGSGHDLAALLNGNYDARGLEPVRALDPVPTPPRWLKNKDALREWNRLAPILTANGLLNEGNIGLLQQLCAVHGHLVLLWSTGAKANAALIATYRMLSNSPGLLGFNIPSAKPSNRFTKYSRLPRGAR